MKVVLSILSIWVIYAEVELLDHIVFLFNFLRLRATSIGQGPLVKDPWPPKFLPYIWLGCLPFRGFSLCVETTKQPCFEMILFTMCSHFSEKRIGKAPLRIQVWKEAQDTAAAAQGVGVGYSLMYSAAFALALQPAFFFSWLKAAWDGAGSELSLNTG